ncbi:hypothetical protein T07_4673 [Trichinella nelsoni]|uniref:Uncharacterized protein n=1 Tax=Trichinella nelsoni TaxID=6336 RepID=A0A0V0RIT8_9BILA|nr:hypothetical protein T07_4673 [Trichinella nelsoni]
MSCQLRSLSIMCAIIAEMECNLNLSECPKQREEQAILQSGSPRARALERARENSPDKRMRL